MASTLAADVAGTGAGGTISDDGVPNVSTITIVEDEVIEDVRFSIEGLEHTWAGDLVVTVTHVDTGTTASLFNRPQRFPSTTDTGDSSDLNGTYVFEDGGADFWQETASQPNEGVVTPGTYFASDIAGNPVSLNDLFGGESSAGDWQISISDEFEREVGSFAAWSLEFGTATAVPEPGTAVSLGLLAMLGGTFYRRRKQS